MERCLAAFSSRSTERGQTYSFDDVYEKLSDNSVSPLLIVFSSDYDNFRLYADLFSERFPDSQIIGTTSSYNHSSEGGSEKALSAVAVYNGLECVGGVLENAGLYPIRNISRAQRAIAALNISENETDNVCCLEFTAFCGCGTELVLDTLRCAAGGIDIPLIGCTAAARRGTERSYVSLNGKIYDDACVFMYIRNLCGRISIIRENTFRNTEHFFRVTNVDCEKCRVYEINGNPAAKYLASLLGIGVSDLAENITRHPIGRLYGDNIYISDARAVIDYSAIEYYAHIYNYSRAVLLAPDNVRSFTDSFFTKLKNTGFSPSFSFAVNCALDQGIYSDKGFSASMTERLTREAGCFSGVSGLGEQTGYLHLNKTMVLAAFE
ncbi:MAG: hypothetical protein J6X60_06045 [Ruminiclostridium sp.]|nr:hypothetical protein [Ruminiclostridium sp.]